MQGKVILEEHFAIQATLNNPATFAPHVWQRLGPQLLDIEKMWLPEMDRNGIEWMILSLNAPAVQAIWDVKRAIAVARDANDHLAAEVAKHPNRFVGLAALPMQDPVAATTELQRCVRELGFKGALVNGFSQAGEENTALYYDLPQYRPFWAAVESLDVPFYLHPRNPLPSWAPNLEGHSWMLGASWAFAAETAVHALRLIGSGLFDAHPRLKIILGHLGEGLPFLLWRINMALQRDGAGPSWFRDAFSEHFWITTSGFFSDPALLLCVQELGADRIMFSVDYPFVDNAPGTEWLARIPLCAEDKAKIMSGNAKRLLKM